MEVRAPGKHTALQSTIAERTGRNDNTTMGMWDEFLLHFCRTTNFLCTNQQPTWFGWGLIAVLLFALAYVLLRGHCFSLLAISQKSD